MTPEQKSRQQIDRQLEQAGWVVQDYRQMNISAGRGVAVREFPLTTGQADDMLYVDARAIGVVEAKPKGHTLSGVETQSGKYLDGLPRALPNYRLPLPFAYESTGEVTQFTNTLEPHARSRLVFSFHRPDELLRLVQLDTQVRGRLRQMPQLNTIARRLRHPQVDVHPRRQIDGRIRQFRLGRLRIARQHALAGPNRLNRPGVIRLTGRPPHPLASGGLSRGRIFGQTTSHGPHGLSRRTDSPGPRLPEPTRHGGHRQHNREAPTKAPADTGARGPLPPGPCRGPPRPRCHRHRRTHS
jgi:hypothetical protein